MVHSLRMRMILKDDNKLYSYTSQGGSAKLGAALRID